MTTKVKRLLDTFDALDPSEKQEAVVEVLRRASQGAPGNLPEEALLQAADSLFRDLDAREAADARP